MGEIEKSTIYGNRTMGRIFSRFWSIRLENMANDLASADYVKDKTQHCPHCNAPIEKNDGCNKVQNER